MEVCILGFLEGLHVFVIFIYSTYSGYEKVEWGPLQFLFNACFNRSFSFNEAFSIVYL
jgi:hypothetical protein